MTTASLRKGRRCRTYAKARRNESILSTHKRLPLLSARLTVKNQVAPGIYTRRYSVITLGDPDWLSLERCASFLSASYAGWPCPPPAIRNPPAPREGSPTVPGGWTTCPAGICSVSPCLQWLRSFVRQSGADEHAGVAACPRLMILILAGGTVWAKWAGNRSAFIRASRRPPLLPETWCRHPSCTAPPRRS
jgi:hypothetical protein